MHMWVIYVKRHLSRTHKKSPCSGRDPSIGSLTLYLVVVKAGLYRKSVQVYEGVSKSFEPQAFSPFR